MRHLTIEQIKARISGASAEEIATLEAELVSDGRRGVREALASARKRLDAARAEGARLEALAARERDLYAHGLLVVAGVDEVGRGALAGPVSAGACVFAADVMIEGLDDSKRLSPGQRSALDTRIRERASACAVAHVGPHDIDRLGIARATLLAMRSAIDALQVPVCHVLVDGAPVGLHVPCTSVVRGDSSVRAIAAASILAKVARDALMVELDDEYPGYGFAGNKGYGSADHLKALARTGPSPVHRLTFAPCAQRSLF